MDVLSSSIPSLKLEDLLNNGSGRSWVLSFADIYMRFGQPRRAIELLEKLNGRQDADLIEDHSKRLASQHVLARVYLADGQVAAAVQLTEHVVKVQEIELAEDHPGCFASQRVLANAY
ncbi:hypothetical protein K431DRAFT_284994 [Polychaeton citri CBS 116435]|uniref:Uncharacterized protein n=1 Tax=Polychaeton citri CBS 116435 TaxID=1314669 RepID=A0A9P4Q6B5_9PEZI|nr:hypothetical protein K431DRAFT_284994 [Polychaeton citri CBS 116435]